MALQAYQLFAIVL